MNRAASSFSEGTRPAASRSSVTRRRVGLRAVPAIAGGIIGLPAASAMSPQRVPMRSIGDDSAGLATRLPIRAKAAKKAPLTSGAFLFARPLI
jgi:hypothetical protein